MIVIRSKRVRDVLRVALPFAAMPALVTLGALVFSEKQHLIVSLGMACMALLFFLTGFEKRKTGGRRMVIVSVMTALCIVGRFIPLFKPVTALTIITAMYLGGEAGFLTGALSAAMSNFYFGSGSLLCVASCALKNASPKLDDMLRTSPVERISGPSTGSTSWNILNGNTASFTP